MPITTRTGQTFWVRPFGKQGVAHEWSSSSLEELGPPLPGHRSKDLLLISSSQTAQATEREGWEEGEWMFGSPTP